MRTLQEIGDQIWRHKKKRKDGANKGEKLPTLGRSITD